MRVSSSAMILLSFINWLHLVIKTWVLKLFNTFMFWCKSLVCFIIPKELINLELSYNQPYMKISFTYLISKQCET
jgi:hypothetical protein